MVDENTFSEKRIIITILLIVVFYTFFVVFSDLDKIQKYFLQINLHYLFPIIGLMILSLFIRSFIQRIFLIDIGLNLSIKENFRLYLSGLSMIITPLGSGTIIKSHIIKKNYDISASRSMPVILFERFHDFLAISVVIVVSLFVVYSIESLVIIVISFSLILSFLFLLKGKKLSIVLNVLTSKIPFFRNRFEITSDFNESLIKIFSKKTFVTAVLLTLTSTFIEGFVVYLGFLAFDINFGYLETVQIYYTSLLTGALSLIPGGIGITEGSFLGLLLKNGLDTSLATSIIIFTRLSVIWFVTSIGIIVLYFTIIIKKS